MHEKLYVIYERDYGDYGPNNKIILCTDDKEVSDKLNGFKDYESIEYIQNNSSLDEMICENNSLKIQLNNAIKDREVFERNYINTRRKLDLLESQMNAESSYIQASKEGE